MSLPLDAWLEAAATALDRRLRAKGSDRAARRAGRALLASAFDARERGAVTLDLVRAVDRAAHPPTIAIPAPPRIGMRWMRVRPDPAWLERLGAVDALAARIEGRIEPLIESLRAPQVKEALWPVVERADDPPNFTFTEG